MRDLNTAERRTLLPGLRKLLDSTYDLLHHLIHGLLLFLHLPPAVPKEDQDPPKSYQT